MAKRKREKKTNYGSQNTTYRKQHYYKNTKPPSYYDIGNRYLNILHTRMRNNCSALHNDLCHANLIHSPSCSCGYSTENAEHFLLYCKRSDAHRNILYRSLLAANVHLAVWKSNL